MCYAKLCEVTRNRNVVPGDIFPPYRTVCVKVISSTLMRMRRLIWVCAGRKGLIIPKVFSKFPHSDPPKLGQFPCFLKIFTNAALFPEYIWVLPRSKENPGSPIHCSSTQHGPQQRSIWKSTGFFGSVYLLWPHKWVRHGHFYLICCRKQNKHMKITKITKRIKHLPPIDE